MRTLFCPVLYCTFPFGLFDGSVNCWCCFCSGVRQFSCLGAGYSCSGHSWLSRYIKVKFVDEERWLDRGEGWVWGNNLRAMFGTCYDGDSGAVLNYGYVCCTVMNSKLYYGTCKPTFTWRDCLWMFVTAHQTGNLPEYCRRIMVEVVPGIKLVRQLCNSDNKQVHGEKLNKVQTTGKFRSKTHHWSWASNLLSAQGRLCCLWHINPQQLGY